MCGCRVGDIHAHRSTHVEARGNFPEWVVFSSRMGRTGEMLNSGWQARTESPFTYQPPWLPHLCVFKSLKMRFDSGLSSAFYLGFSGSLNNTHTPIPISTLHKESQGDDTASISVLLSGAQLLFTGLHSHPLPNPSGFSLSVRAGQQNTLAWPNHPKCLWRQLLMSCSGSGLLGGITAVQWLWPPESILSVGPHTSAFPRV